MLATGCHPPLFILPIYFLNRCLWPTLSALGAVPVNKASTAIPSRGLMGEEGVQGISAHTDLFMAITEYTQLGKGGRWEA